MERQGNDLDSTQDVQAYLCATKKSRWLTVVYRDLDTAEAQELLNHKNCSAASWSHAIQDAHHYKAMLKVPVQAQNTAQKRSQAAG